MGKIPEKELYFITLQHCVGLLKEEVQHFFPEWSFREGHHNFLTFKTQRDRTLEEVHDIPLVFKLICGEILGVSDKSNVEKMALDAQEKYNALTLHRWDLVEEDGVMGDRKVKGIVIDIIRIAQDEYACGVRYQVRGDFAPFKGASPIPCPDINMKHGHQKMGEVFKHFRPHVAHEEVFLDIGCSPGGSTYYLLNNGYRVIGVDCKDVDAQLTEDFKEGFLQLKEPIEEIKVKNLKGLPPIDWVVSNLDMRDIKSLSFLLKLTSKLDECKGIFFHIKVGERISFDDINKVEKLVKESGFNNIRKGLLPSHSREYCLYAKKED